MTPLEYLDWLEENWDLVQDKQPRPNIDDYQGDFCL
jgi:hypothetical protein